MEIWRQILNFSIQVSAQSESQSLLEFQRKCNFLLSQVFTICYHSHNLIYFVTRSVSQKTLHVIETKNFTIELLVLQNRHLHDVHSISDIKLSWFFTNFAWKKTQIYNFINLRKKTQFIILEFERFLAEINTHVN